MWCLKMSTWMSKILRCLRHGKNIENRSRHPSIPGWMSQKTRFGGVLKVCHVSLKGAPRQHEKPTRHFFHPLPMSDMSANVALAPVACLEGLFHSFWWCRPWLEQCPRKRRVVIDDVLGDILASREGDVTKILALIPSLLRVFVVLEQMSLHTSCCLRRR